MGKQKQAPSADGRKIIAKNRRARHDYFIEETYEAGVSLLGSEVKSCRDGKVSLADAYATVDGGELWLVNAHITEYAFANQFNHDPRRRRKLLMHHREILRLGVKLNERGFTLAVLSLYFLRGKVKAELGLARGKRAHDKRETIRAKDERREAEQLRKG
ncbi:MAG: SsrA-binding protein SmpB [Polyangia bacterium]|jgi:SsrA-binding protein|nr:SsrA-binding protein SmpB [Polyangia bacterium]